MTRLDVSFLGRTPGLIVRDFRSIEKSRRRTLTPEGLIWGAITVGLIWLAIVLVWCIA